MCVLQMSLAGHSTTMFTPEAVRCRRDNSLPVFWRWNHLVASAALQVGFLTVCY